MIDLLLSILAWLFLLVFCAAAVGALYKAFKTAFED